MPHRLRHSAGSPDLRHRWEFTPSKNFSATSDLRFQFRVDFTNTFNQLQWLADPHGRHVHGFDLGVRRSR